MGSLDQAIFTGTVFMVLRNILIVYSFYFSDEQNIFDLNDVKGRRRRVWFT